MLSSRRRALAAAFLLSSTSLPALAQGTSFSGPPAADIVVTANRVAQPIQRAGSAITVITAEEIERESVRDVGQILRRAPGVSLTQAGGPGRTQTVRIRGGDVRHTLVLIDGIRVNDPTATGREFDFSNLVLADIERIEVLRGPQSALYGSDALGGVINIITKRGRGAPRASLQVEGGSYGTREVRGQVSGGNDVVDYSIGVAGFESAGFSAFGYRIGRLRYAAPIGGFEPDATRRAGVTGRIGVRLADDLRLELGGSANENRVQYDAGFLPFPDSPSLGTSRLFNVYGRLIHDPAAGPLRSTVTLFANRTDRTAFDATFGQGGVFCYGSFAVGPGLRPCRTRTEFIGDRAGAEYQGDLKLGPFGLLTFGARAERETADSFSNGIIPRLTATRRDLAAEQTTRSIFALHQIVLAERLNLSVGGRIDDVPGVDRFSTGRATLAYLIPETDTKLRASIGTGGKAPSLYQLYSPAFGNAGLESERSVGVDAGIDQGLFDGALRLSATAFANRYKNLIDFGANPACRRDQPFGCYYNVQRAQTSGVELSGTAELVPGALTARFAYTYLEAEDRLTQKRLARRPEGEGRVGLAWTPTPDILIEPSVTLVSQRYDFPNEQGKLKPYARLDLYASYRVNDTFSLFARAENLTDARYEEVRNFGTPGRSVYGGVKATW